MGTYSDLLFGAEADTPTLEPVQAPVERPAPVARPGGLSPRPRSAAPETAIPAQPPQEGGSEMDAWLGLRRKHNLPFEDLPALVDDLRSVQGSGRSLRPLPPELEADLRAHGQRFPFRQQQTAPQAAPEPRQQAPVASPPQMAQPQQMPAQAAPEAAPQPRRSYSDEMFGAQPSAPTAPKVQAPPSADAEPDAPTWLGRRAQDVLGKQDKRYTNLPTIAEALKTEGNMGPGTAGKEMWAWLTGASDKDMAGVYKGVLGDRFVRDETDANGYPVVVYRGQDGKEAKAYVNKPGLDMQDVVRGVTGIAPNVGAGRLVSGAMKGSNLAGRMIGQALGQGGASVAQDAAGVVTGVSDIDPERSAVKAGASAIGGAAGEAIAAPMAYAWRKLVTEPRYFNKATGQLTDEGIAAAEAAGIDAKSITPQVARQFSREMARTGDPVAATSQTAANEFGIRRTVGELTKDQDKLLREQQFFAGNYGERAARDMKAFREGQKADIEGAVRGMADEMAPARAGQPLGKDELGANVRANTQQAYDTAKEFETKAWKEVPEFKASQEMLRHLDEVSLPKGLKQRQISVIEEGLTPAAKEMSDMVEKFVAGEMPTTASKYVDKSLAGQVDVMRRRLLAASEKAADKTDQRAAKAIYDSFNDWVVDAARMSGDPMIATQMVTARTLSREIHEAFDGVKGTAGERILGNVLKKADSAEGVIDALFSGQTKSSIKSGSIDALERLKTAYSKYLEPEAAKAAVDDLKLAFFQRAVMKNGQIMEPKALSSSLKNMVSQQRSVLVALGVSKEEGARIMRLAALLDDVARRNPNTSWSGVTMSQFMKDVGGALFTMLGGNSIAAKVVAGPALRPFQEQYGRALAGSATGAGQGARVPRLPPPPLAGPAGGIAGSGNR